ncbi:MAG: glycoside hydrolase domain-containing protein [Nocardioides sp.]
MPRRLSSVIGRASISAALAASLLGVGTAAEAKSPNPATPGNFTGYGFDQCLAPTQKAMNTWLNHSPFLAVGIYIAGDSRGCRSQPNLTKKWVRVQINKGWRLMPITLGPQAPCNPSFPRYGDDKVINPSPGAEKRYSKAAKQGTAEAKKAVDAAAKLGISKGSTLWYDLEGFSISITDCRESSLRFLSAWTKQIHRLGYASGVYSSSGSGIKMLDDARTKRADSFTMPDQIWIARWDGKANTSADGISEAGWNPGGRMKQYQGGHYETWGAVTINIDRNWLDLGKGTRGNKESHCGGVAINSTNYPKLREPTATKKPNSTYVEILKCVLSERAGWTGTIDGTYGSRIRKFVVDWKVAHRLDATATVNLPTWVALFSSGKKRVVKFGSGEASVRDLQRALNAAMPKADVHTDGVFGLDTASAVTRYQKRVGISPSGIANTDTWKALKRGRI